MLIGSPPPSPAPPVVPAADGRARLAALDGLRGAAALAVLTVHVWMFVYGSGGRFGPPWMGEMLGQLRLGMPLFFVLSGFLIFRPFAAAALDRAAGPGIAAYGLRRLARIGPAYWVAILLSALVLAALGHGQAQPVERLPIFLLFLQNYVPATAGQLDPPTWSVVIEVSFYAVVPLLGIVAAAGTARLLSLRRRRQVLALACVALLVGGAALLGLASLHGWGRDVRDTLPARMASFAAGMLVAVLVHDRAAGRRTVRAILLTGLALVLLEAVAQGLRLGPSAVRHLLVDTPASLGFALIIAAVALGRAPGVGVLRRGPLQWWGVRSYSLYLWHFPVIYVLRSLDLWSSGGLLPNLALTLAVATVLAMASWRWLEQPAIAWAHRRAPRRTARPVRLGAPASSGAVGSG